MPADRDIDALREVVPPQGVEGGPTREPDESLTVAAPRSRAHLRLLVTGAAPEDAPAAHEAPTTPETTAQTGKTIITGTFWKARKNPETVAQCRDALRSAEMTIPVVMNGSLSGVKDGWAQLATALIYMTMAYVAGERTALPSYEALHGNRWFERMKLHLSEHNYHIMRAEAANRFRDLMHQELSAEDCTHLQEAIADILLHNGSVPDITAQIARFLHGKMEREAQQ